MKKIKFFGIILLLVCVMVLSGCTRSGNAKIETCNILYEKVTKNYYRDERTEKIRVFDADGNVDLYSINSYDSIKTFNYIASVDTEGSLFVFNLLRENGEYATLIKAVSDFYILNNKSNHTLKDAEVPQEIKSKLYNRIDELGGVLNKVKSSKKSLQTTVDNFSSDSEVPVEQALKNFLNNYKLLIEKFFEISSTYEEIYTKYIYVIDTKTEIASGGMERLVRGSEIYLAKYYYLKHFVLNGYDDRFSFQKVYDAKTETFVDNPTYDEGFEKLVKIANTFVSDYEDEDHIFYYGCCLSKYETLKTNLVNYEKAVKYIAGLKGKTNGNKIAEQYLEFMANFDQEVLDYENYLDAKIIV